MRYFILFVSIIFVIFAISSCGEEEEEMPPTSGTVSGTVTFIGTPPEGNIEIQVSIFSVVDEKGRPTGPPDRHSDPFTQFTGQVQYTISGVPFGTYKLAAVGYENKDNPPGMPETVLGMYGFKPPDDMTPDSFTIIEDQPDATGIDIVANYSAITQ